MKLKNSYFAVQKSFLLSWWLFCSCWLWSK